MLARRLATLILAFACATDSHAADSPAEIIDRYVQPYLDNDMVVGMTVALSRQGQSLIRGYGRLSADDPRPPAGDTVFEIGSATKPFTGLLLADGVTRGRLKLDQPAGTLLPPGVTMPGDAQAPITLTTRACRGCQTISS